MNRRDVITFFGGAAATGLLVALAQQRDGRTAALLARTLQLRADSTAAVIGRFIDDIVRQVSLTQAPMEHQRREDAVRLLGQAPDVTEIVFVDASGIERLKYPESADLVISKWDWSQTPQFTEAMAHKIYLGPVHLRGLLPYMTISRASARRESGVSVAEVSLKLVWDLIQQLKVGEHGVAYVLDSQGRVIAHSAMFTPPVDGEHASYQGDPSLFQRDLSGLPQIQAVRAAASGPAEVRAGRDLDGRNILSASAGVAGPDERSSGVRLSDWLGWRVFVELPLSEADTAVP